MSYEFSDDEARVFDMFSILCIFVGSIIILFSIISAIGAPNDPTYQDFLIIRFTSILLEISMGVLFVIPAYQFRQITQTVGSDIQHLMEGMRKLRNGFKWITYIIIADIVVNLTLGFLAGGA